MQASNIATLKQILRDPFSCMDSDSAACIEMIVAEAEEALKGGAFESRIIPARRRVGLRALMRIQMVRDGGLRVEVT